MILWFDFKTVLIIPFLSILSQLMWAGSLSTSVLLTNNDNQLRFYDTFIRYHIYIYIFQNISLLAHQPYLCCITITHNSDHYHYTFIILYFKKYPITFFIIQLLLNNHYVCWIDIIRLHLVTHSKPHTDFNSPIIYFYLFVCFTGWYYSQIHLLNSNFPVYIFLSPLCFKVYFCQSCPPHLFFLCAFY